MNERVKELAEQAFFETEYDDVQNLPETMERFAELIVRECMLCSDSLAKHYINTHPEKEQVWLLAAIADYSNEIEKHFGVNNETK